MPAHFEVAIESHFCSAHALRHYKGATEPTHGHNFKTIVTVTGSEVDRAGMLIDFLVLKPIVDEEIGRLNYCFLNESVDEFREDKGGVSPSAENIARVLFQRIQKRLPREAKLAGVQVYESPGCSATYRE